LPRAGEFLVTGGQPESRFRRRDIRNVAAAPQNMLNGNVWEVMRPQTLYRLDRELSAIQRIAALSAPAVARFAEIDDFAADDRLAGPRDSAVLVIAMGRQQGIDSIEGSELEEGDLAPDDLLGGCAEHEDFPRQAHLPGSQGCRDRCSAICRADLVVTACVPG